MNAYNLENLTCCYDCNVICLPKYKDIKLFPPFLQSLPVCNILSLLNKFTPGQIASQTGFVLLENYFTFQATRRLLGFAELSVNPQKH